MVNYFSVTSTKISPRIFNPVFSFRSRLGKLYPIAKSTLYPFFGFVLYACLRAKSRSYNSDGHSKEQEPIFVNKVAVEHSHAHSLTSVYGQFHDSVAVGE